MSDIKPGDLVMIVKPMPCCGDNATLGNVFIVKSISGSDGVCGACGDYQEFAMDALRPDGGYTQLSRLKKIDPPAEGDSLPTRKDLEVPYDLSRP